MSGTSKRHTASKEAKKKPIGPHTDSEDLDDLLEEFKAKYTNNPSDPPLKSLSLREENETFSS
jgi:hypothetical protein